MVSKALKSGILAAILGSGLLFFAIPAKGQDVVKSLTLSRNAKVGSQSLAQGKYSIKFDDKKDGEAVVMKDGREVLKASYKITTLAKEAQDSAVVYAASDDGGFKIRRIEIKGMKVALQFD